MVQKDHINKSKIMIMKLIINFYVKNEKFQIKNPMKMR